MGPSGGLVIGGTGVRFIPFEGRETHALPTVDSLCKHSCTLSGTVSVSRAPIHRPEPTVVLSGADDKSSGLTRSLVYQYSEDS